MSNICPRQQFLTVGKIFESKSCYITFKCTEHSRINKYIDIDTEKNEHNLDAQNNEHHPSFYTISYKTLGCGYTR